MASLLPRYHYVRGCLFIAILAPVFFGISLVMTSHAVEVSYSTGDPRYNDGQGNIMPYRLYVPPGYDASGMEYPLILYLHGAGDNGTNNVWPSKPPNAPQMINGLFNAARGNLGVQYKAFFLVPQSTSEWGWNDYRPDYQEYLGQELAMKILNLIISSYPVDTNRLYVTGLSMGGFGTFDFIAHYPNTFAAAVPMSGGGDPIDAPIIKDIPIWAMHGVADTTVPVSNTDDMFDTIESAGGYMEYTRLNGVGHNDDYWEAFYNGTAYKNSKGQTLYQWMFDQSMPIAEPTSAILTGVTLICGLFYWFCRTCLHKRNNILYE